MSYNIRIAEPVITDDDIRAVVEALRERRLSGGKYVALFEKELSAYLGGAVMLFSGRVSYKIGNEDDRIVEAGEIIEILAGSPHYFKALIDTVAVEWGATIQEKKEYDPPFRQIVDEINRKANSDAL